MTDLITEGNKGLNCKRIVQCNANTYNTPYKAGLTTGTAGTAYINMSSVDNGTIMYVHSGNQRLFLLSKTSGSWGNWIELNPDFKVIYDSGGLILSKSGNMIEVVFMACKQLPKKAEIDSTAGGEKWIAKKSSYNIIWNYLSGAGTPAVLQISNADGFTAVKDINNADITTYQLYGRFMYAI